jgi:HEPN domain-containing protein
MSNEKVNFENIVNHWISNSDKDFETMNHLFETKDFHWSLFIGHLVIEKLLKAKIVKVTNEHPPFSHDLRRLAKLTGLSFNEEHLRWLDTITSFNLNARYDNYKQEFYLKCTHEFAAVWIKNINEIRLWIKERL